jgi:diguanylate cyclase (GGDEF)-like protein
MANQAGRFTATEPPEAWQGPAIVGLTHVFADPDVERRYMSAAEPHSRRRLAMFVTVAALLSVVSSLLLVVPQPVAAGTHPIWPGLMQLAVTIGFGVVLMRTRLAAAIEWLGLAFGVFFAAAICLALVAQPDEAGGAIVMGSISLLYLLLPVRLTFLGPLAACASGAMIAAWSIRDPVPQPAAVAELLLWVWVVNLLGIMVLRTVRLSLRTQWAQAQTLLQVRSHDGLTGLASRQFIEQALAREWVQGQRTAAPLSLLLVNVDHFRLLNDCIGYEAGDACLREVGATIGACFTGPGDLVARVGGDEFAGLSSDTGEQAARAVAERIMEAMRAAAIAHPCSPIGPHVTVSIGVATARPMKFHQGWELMALADRLLHAAKHDGRNRLSQQTLGAAPPPPPPGGRRADAATGAAGKRAGGQTKKPARPASAPVN